MGAHKGNKYALGNTGGQPPMFSSVEQLSEAIQSYFDDCVPELSGDTVLDYNYPTITGMALYLGFASRQSIYDYKDNKEFSYTIKRAMMAIENHYEQRLNYQNATGAIFALKNMGWQDNKNIDLKDERKTLDIEERENRIKELKLKLGIDED